MNTSVAALPQLFTAERQGRWADTMSSNKRWTLEKREQELRHVLVSGANQEAIARAAEHVREAQLAILKKAESEAAPDAAKPASRTKARSTIQRERQKWLDATIAEIISQVQPRKA